MSTMTPADHSRGMESTAPSRSRRSPRMIMIVYTQESTAPNPAPTLKAVFSRFFTDMPRAKSVTTTGCIPAGRASSRHRLSAPLPSSSPLSSPRCTSTRVRRSSKRSRAGCPRRVGPNGNFRAHVASPGLSGPGCSAGQTSNKCGRPRSPPIRSGCPTLPWYVSDPAGTKEKEPRHGNVRPSAKDRHQRDEPGSRQHEHSGRDYREFGQLHSGGIMTRWSKAKLLALLSSAGGALFLWRRPAKTTEITVRRRPVDEEPADK